MLSIFPNYAKVFGLNVPDRCVCVDLIEKSVPDLAPS